MSARARRNRLVQIVGLLMVSMTCLSVTPWPVVLGWAAAACAVLAAEDMVLKTIARGDRDNPRMRTLAALLRVAATTLYALAALTLIARGGPVERMFAFALMSASMVHVLMRYHRSPWILGASLTPYALILGLIAYTQASTAIAKGHSLQAVIAGFVLVMFAVQLWSLRAQLSEVWDELMTARQAAEERARAAAAASQAKSNFLATMSHELRTPLNGVLGMVQALNGEALTQTQRDRVNVIRRSSENLLAVLNDLLDLSKVEAGALELDVVEFDLEHLVRGVLAAYSPLAERKGLTFAFDVSPAACGRYQGDSARIRRVLYSLADNAVKFTEAGGVTLSVLREAETVIFRISDTGIGIGAEDLTHLFDGFFQADASLSRPYGGAGLGLAICRDITQLMGGAVEATSEPGRGSTFVVRVPLRAAAPAVGDVAAAAIADDEAAAPRELRVLAAEDNLTNQLVLKTLLAQAGIEPTLVETGREALDAWEDQAWDIILMDIQMPQMDGIAATRAIRTREIETGRPRTPILAVTANAMTHQVTAYETAGMDGLIPKPIDVATLFHTMEQALARPDGGGHGEAAAA